MMTRGRRGAGAGPTHILRTSLLSGVLALAALPATADSIIQTNLVSDLPGLAAVTDPNLVNPWGIASSSTSPFWVSDNGTGLSTLYNGAGQPFPLGSPLVVTIPPPSGGTPPSAPTGVVFNPTASFGGARFIFSTEDGTIASWAGGTTAIRQADNAPFGAIYKGLALGNNGADLLYATNFHAGTIDVFNSAFGSTTVPGGFIDPNLPAGFAPFGIQNIGGKLYVTYAKQDETKEDDVAGPGNGFVDVFDANGSLAKRLISNGPLNSPWGLAIAPDGFGPFVHDLLVGNFGDGRINAFDPLTGAFEGALTDPNGNPIAIEGLWGLRVGNGGNGGDLDKVYFTAGIPGPDAVEDHGLFGSLAFAPEPATLALFAAGVIGLGFVRRRSTR